MTTFTAPRTQPPQAWAHRQGKINLRPLRASDWSIEAIAARAQIAEAFNRFGLAHDEARVDVVVSCMTEDVFFEVARGQAAAFNGYHGRAQLFEKLTLIISQQSDQRRHLIGNVLVEELDLADGTATALAYSVVTVAADGLSVGASVIYSARLRREDDGCWRFCYFYIGMDEYAGQPPPAGES